VRAETANFQNFPGRRDEERRVAASRPSWVRTAAVRSGPMLLARGPAPIALAPHDVAEARLALALRPGVLRSQKARLPPPFAGIARPGSSGLQHAREHLESRSREMLRDSCNHDRVAHSACPSLFPQRFREGNPAATSWSRLALGEILEHAGNHRSIAANTSSWVTKLISTSSLVELAGRAVGARSSSRKHGAIWK